MVAEHSQTDWDIARVQEWAKMSGQLGDDDILIFASVDEVLSRPALHQLKWCQTSADVISGALWVPMGNLHKAMRPDFQVQGHTHTFAMPTIYKWGGITRGEQSGRRLFYSDLGARYVSGGLHMKSSAYIPTFLLKDLTATEDDYFGSSVNLPYFFSMDQADLALEQVRVYSLSYRMMWQEALDPVESVHDVDFQLPWFLDCNRERFPYWYGRLDPRNDLLLDRITNFKNKEANVQGSKNCPYLFYKNYIVILQIT